MAHNPQAPQSPQGNHDPAGSTQMFRAFVDADGARPRAAAASSGPRTGLVVAVVALAALVGAVAWFTLA